MPWRAGEGAAGRGGKRSPKRNRYSRSAPQCQRAFVVDHRKVEPMSEDEHRRRGEAADRLWQEIKRRVAEGR